MKNVMIYKKLPVYAPYIFMILFFSSFYMDAYSAQNQPSSDYLKRVESALEQEDYKAAEKILKKELKKQKQNKIPIWIELGKLMTEQEKWSKAKDWFRKAEKQDPENLLVHYYLGICQREIGKFQATIMRLYTWHVADKKFKRVLSADSSFMDVLYQYALLERLRKRYTEAIAKGHIQIKLKPYLEEANIGLFFLYRTFLFHKSFEEVRQWLLQNPDDVSRYFLGELYRQNDRLTSADSIFQILMNQKIQMSRIPVYLSRVRLNLSLKNPLGAEEIYWQAIAAIQDSLDARFLFEDLKYVCFEEEISQYNTLKSVSQWQDFFRKFWVKRDPLPAAPDNLRLIEHFRRMIYVEANFRYDGFRSWLANPDQQEYLKFPKSFYLNREFNDKGLIYVRHGPPDDKATALGEEVAYNESWLYRERDGFQKMIFHFEIDRDGLAGDWRLTPMLRDSASIDAVVLWDGAYARYLRGDMTIRNRVANEIANISKENVSIALSSDRHSWAEKVEPLQVNFSIANFRETNYRDLCELYIGFPVDNILKKLPEDSTLTVDIGVAILDKDWNEVAKRNQFVEIHPTHPSIYMGEFVRHFQFKLMPKSYNFSFHVDPIHIPELGGLKMVVTLPSFPDGQLLASDIQLAHEITPKNNAKKLSKNNMVFIPNPSKKFKINSLIHVYLEIYNLTKDSKGRTSYTVSYTAEDTDGKRKRGFLGLFGRKKSSTISLKSERIGISEMEPEYITLDVSELTPGKKKLHVRIYDNNSHQTTETETIFWIE